MAPGLQREMETRFGGEDFSDVSLHTGTAARSSSEAVGAEAYTTHTNHIVFRSAVDKKTLAHELEHVRQQRAGAVAGTDNGSGVRISDESDPFEKAAERTARQAMRGGADVQRAVAKGSTAPASAAVQRMPKKKTPKTAPAETSAQAAAPAKSEAEKIIEYFDALDEGFKAKEQNAKEIILENIGIGTAYTTLADVEGDAELSALFHEELGTAEHEPGFQTASVGGGGSSDWAAKAVTNAHADMRIRHPFWGDKTSSTTRSPAPNWTTSSRRRTRTARGPRRSSYSWTRSGTCSNPRPGTRRRCTTCPPTWRWGRPVTRGRGTPVAEPTSTTTRVR